MQVLQSCLYEEREEGIMEDEPRVYTPDEVRDRLLDYIANLIKYWDNQKGTSKENMAGLIFSTLVALDGGSLDLPAFLVTPIPDETDAPFCREQRENWYPEDKPDLGVLHEFWHDAARRNGVEKGE